MRFNRAASATACAAGCRLAQAWYPAFDTPSVRAMVAIGKSA